MAGQQKHRSLVRLRTLTHPKKSLFLAVTAAAALGIVAVPASAAGAPARDNTPIAVETGPRPVDQNAAYYATVARGAANLADGKVSTAALDKQIDELQESADSSPATVRAMTAELRTTTSKVAAKVVTYDKEQARKAAARKAAAEKARKEAAARAAEQANQVQASSGSSGSSAPAPASVSASGGNSPSAARAYARSVMAAKYGWGDDQFSCLNSLWNRESGWRVNAANPSGAYGIPQALPGSKMGAGWQSSATVQVDWGLGYIKSRYGTPCGAWGHSQSTGWY
jgi:hypothetical protein